jgi:hypothetical protein
MKINTLIAKLKTDAAGLSGRVAGSAEFEEATQRTDLTLPCAFVIRMAESPDPDQAIDRTLQTVEEIFAVIVGVSNTADAKGGSGDAALDDIKADLFSALLGWAPDADHNPMEYRGSQHLTMDRARLWHQYEFSTQTIISNL